MKSFALSLLAVFTAAADIVRDNDVYFRNPNSITIKFKEKGHDITKG